MTTSAVANRYANALADVVTSPARSITQPTPPLVATTSRPSASLSAASPTPVSEVNPWNCVLYSLMRLAVAAASKTVSPTVWNELAVAL